MSLTRAGSPFLSASLGLGSLLWGHTSHSWDDKEPNFDMGVELCKGLSQTS